MYNTFWLAQMSNNTDPTMLDRQSNNEQYSKWRKLKWILNLSMLLGEKKRRKKNLIEFKRERENKMISIKLTDMRGIIFLCERNFFYQLCTQWNPWSFVTYFLKEIESL